MYDNDQDYSWKSYDNQRYGSEPERGERSLGRLRARSLRERKREDLSKKLLCITAGAVLFGTVSGVTMSGVNMVSSRFLENALGGKETEASEESQAISSEQEAADNRQEAAGNGSEDPGAVLFTDVSSIVESAMPSVVAITSTAVYQSNNFGYGWFFGGPQTYEVPSSGSGIIVGRMRRSFSLSPITMWWRLPPP